MATLTEAHNMERLTSATITCEVSPTLLTSIRHMTCLLLKALRFSHCTKPASAKCRGLVTKCKGPREGERMEAKQRLFFSFWPTFVHNFHRERELLSVPAGNHERLELDVLGIIVEDMYQRVLSLQNAYFFFYFMKGKWMWSASTWKSICCIRRYVETLMMKKVQLW